MTDCSTEAATADMDVVRCPGNAGVYADLGWTYMEAGRPDKAAVLFGRAVRCSPDIVRRCCGLSLAATTVGDSAGALRQLRKAAQLYKYLAQADGPAAAADLAEAGARLGYMQDGLAILSEMVVTTPLAISLRATLGRTLTQMGRGEDGVLHLQAASAISGHPQRIWEHARLLLALGRSREALEEYTRALTAAPRAQAIYQDYRQALAICNGQTGWFDQALAALTIPIDDIIFGDVLTQSDRFPPLSASPGRRLCFVSHSTYEEEVTSRYELCEGGRRVGGVTDIVAWNRGLLESTRFFQTYRPLLELPKGAGCWTWKPYIILLQLMCCDDGDFVFYHDAGRPPYRYTISRPLAPALAWADRHGGMLPGAYMFPMRCSEYTKRDAFILTGSDREEYWNAPQIGATWSFWRKDHASLSFLRKWLSYCLDPRIVTDYPNVCGEIECFEFTMHRHDQSVLSILCPREGVRAFGDPGAAVGNTYRDINRALFEIEAMP